MSQHSPVYEDVGRDLDTSNSEALAQICHPDKAADSDEIMKIMKKARSEENDDSMSLVAIQKFGRAEAMLNAREFQQHVVEWATEWELAVTERVDRDLKNVKKLQSDRDHYEKKVESLRRRSNELEDKGKTNPKGQVEKLERNENKLKEAFIMYETEAGRLCTLFEAVTRDGWIELYTVRLLMAINIARHGL